MKKILSILSIFLAVFVVSCSTNVARSYELAEANQYTMTFGIIAPKADLKKYTIAALSAKHYSITKQGDDIIAKLNHRGIDAILHYSFKDDMISVDATGSTANGDPIVPLNWIEQVNNSVRKMIISKNYK